MIYLYLQKSSMAIVLFSPSRPWPHSSTSAHSLPSVALISLGRSPMSQSGSNHAVPLQTALLIFSSHAVSASIRAMFMRLSSRGPMYSTGQDQELKWGISQTLGGVKRSSDRAKDHVFARGSSLMLREKTVSGRRDGEVRIARWRE